MVVAAVFLWCGGATLIVLLMYWVRVGMFIYHTINKIPGPRIYPFIGNFLDIHVSSEKLWHVLRGFGKTYYPIYRVWSGPVSAVSLLCPEDIEILLSTTKHIQKSQLYWFLEPWLGTGLLTSTGEKWQIRRKILTPAFHFSILQQFVPIFTEQSEILVEELKQECDKPFTNVMPIVAKFTLHSICETAMGTRLDEKNKEQKSYVHCVHRFGQLVLHQILRPWLYIRMTYMFSPQYWTERKIVDSLHKFSNGVIKERKKNFKDINLLMKTVENDGVGSKKRLAMLDLLISAQKAGAKIDDEGIREEVDTFTFEGHDTTAMCICFTLMLLANHKEVQNKVVDELYAIFGDSTHAPTYQDLQTMPYLEMVLKESLRLYPSVPLIARVAECDFRTQSGYVVPKWVSVLVHIYDLHHNPEIYPDPERFDPERFLPENCQKRHPFAYLPFSAGPRNCIGQKFAMLELKAVVSSILRNFILEPVDTSADIVFLTDIIIRTKDGVRVRFRPRNK